MTVAPLPDELDALRGLGLGTRDFNDNALLLALGTMAAQLTGLFSNVDEALLELASKHTDTLLVVQDAANAPRVTSLGCLAYEWHAQLAQLQAEHQQLRERSQVVRYRSEAIAALGERAGEMTKLLAVGLDFGHNSGCRLSPNFAADWAVWLLKLINACATALEVARQLGNDGDDVAQISTALNQVSAGEGARVVSELLRPAIAGSQREWVQLEQLRELACGGLAWLHILAARDYDVVALRELAQCAGRVALAPAATKVLTTKLPAEDAAAKVAAAVAHAEKDGTDLLELLAAEVPELATELQQLGEPAAALGQLPAWVAQMTAVAQAR